MPNNALFLKIDQRLDEGEMLLEMSTWEDSGPVCGTTRCVAGWAIHETTGQPLYVGGVLNPAMERLAEELGVNAGLGQIAMELLGLEGAEQALFFTDNERARDVVKLFAQNRDDEARRRLFED